VTGLYQRDFEGRLVFQHRSAAKWRLRNDNVDAPEFRHQDECLGFVAELRERWTGKIDELPPASPADAELESTVAEIRWFSLEERGGERRLLEMLPGNRVGIGSSRDRILRWYIRDGSMQIDGADRALPLLSERPGQPVWFSTTDGQPAIELLPVPAAGMDAVGVTVNAIIERFAADRAITLEDATTTIATLARLQDVSDALLRAKSVWQQSPDRLELIEHARRRLGLGNVAYDPKTRGYEGFEE
jgi:hypothetical protein